MADGTDGGPPPARRPGEKGTTLFELIAWFWLMLSLLLAAVPGLARILQTYDLSGATRRVYAELQHMRAASVTTNARQRLTVDETGRVQFERFDAETGQWEAAGVVARELDKVLVSASGPIEFAANGTAPLHGTVTVTSLGGESRSVVVGAAGMVSIASAGGS